MIVKLLRQILALLKRFSNDASYRAWLRLSDKLKSIPPETGSYVSFCGMQIRFSDAQALLNMYDNIFMNECYRFKTANPAPVIIDCGANIGIAALWFSRNYPNASILAFEPDPVLFKILQYNTESNHAHAVLRNEAVWNSTAELKFSSSIKQDGRISESGTEIVKAVRLKEILEKFKQVDLLKMDIEGAEYTVLEDCREELHRVKHLFVECHFNDGDMTEVLSVLRWLHEAGFRCSVQTAKSKSPLLTMKGFKTMDVFAQKTAG